MSKNVSTVLDTRIIKSLYFTRMFMIDYHFEKNVRMNIKNSEYDFDSMAKLLKAMCYDPLINKKVVNILKMDSYPRRLVLSNWLEQLRCNNAPKKLMQSLACLFDDSIAEKVLTFINDHQIKDSECI